MVLLVLLSFVPGFARGMMRRQRGIVFAPNRSGTYMPSFSEPLLRSWEQPDPLATVLRPMMVVSEVALYGELSTLPHNAAN